MPYVGYVIDNLLASDTLDAVNSEDTVYVKEYLYNARPSKPYRATGRGTVGAPEWIRADLGAATNVSFLGLFNHDFLTGIGNEIRIEGNATTFAPGTGAAAWATPMTIFRPNMFKRPNQSYRWWALTIVANAANDLPEIGELFIGQLSQFSSAKLQPGRDDGPVFFRGETPTVWGQDWDAVYSDSDRLNLAFMNINDPSVEDEIQTFLKDVHAAGNKFVLIPDYRRPFCYYCRIKTKESFSRREVYGWRNGEKELRSWAMELQTLTQGISML